MEMPGNQKPSDINRFFEYLINLFYQKFRQEINLPFGKLKDEPVIRFGGFVLEEPYWNEEKKRVEVRRGFHEREPLLSFGNLTVLTRTIYLNELFLYKQLNFKLFFKSEEEFNKFFDLKSLVEVIAHELGHAVLTDIQPETQEVNGGHGMEHDKICEELIKLIEKSEEFKELKKFWK